MSDVTIANTSSGLSGKTLALNDVDGTVSALWSYSRGASAPFAVNSGAANVTNLDADKVDGLHKTDLGQLATAGTWTAAQQFPSGAVGAPGVAVGSATVGLYSSGANALDAATNGVKALGIDSTQFIDSPTQPRAQAYHSTTQSVNNSTVTALLFDSEDYDVGAMHDTGSNTSRFTVPAGGDGLYLLVGTASFASNTSNSRVAFWRKNGSGQLNTESAVAPCVGGNPTEVQTIAMANLVAGDYVELMALQDSGGALNTGSATRRNANQAFIVKLW